MVWTVWVKGTTESCTFPALIFLSNVFTAWVFWFLSPFWSLLNVLFHKNRQNQANEEKIVQISEELKKTKQRQKGELIDTRNTLIALLKEKRAQFQENHSMLMDLSTQILMEETQLRQFRMERADISTKIIITLGPTGGGKSTFCNRIKGDKSLFGDKGPCETSGDSKSCTLNNTKLVAEIDAHKITIIDTPGIGDSFGRDREHSNKLCAYLKGCGGINAFVLIRNGTNPRFDQSFQAMLKEYHGMFGKAFFERLIIVATRIDSKINKMQFEQNNQAQTLTTDICQLFDLEGCAIPVIPMGLEQYEESLVKMVQNIPNEKFVCQQIETPIDALKKERDLIQSKEDALRQEIMNVEIQIRMRNELISAL